MCWWKPIFPHNIPCLVIWFTSRKKKCSMVERGMSVQSVYWSHSLFIWLHKLKYVHCTAVVKITRLSFVHPVAQRKTVNFAWSVQWRGDGLDDLRIGVRFPAWAEMFIFPDVSAPEAQPSYPKVKWYRHRSGVAQRVGRGIALLFHDRGTRRGWVVSSTPRPHFTHWKYPVPILQEAGLAPGPVWKGGKSRPHRDSIPDRPASSQSLYRPSYPAHPPIQSVPEIFPAGVKITAYPMKCRG